jgi:uncharacterized LabA/DUF88 family protein
MANVLLLLEMANLWDDCRAQYGKRARVNFEALIAKAKSKKNDSVKAVAFVSCVPDKNQINLIKKLEELGITVVAKQVNADERADFLPEMLDTLEKELAGCEKVVLGSNNDILKGVLERANGAGKETLIVAFTRNLSTELAGEADNIRALGKNETVIQC